MTRAMRRAAIACFVVAAVVALVPGWSGEERLALFGPHARMTATPVPLDPADPARRRVGRLTYLGGLHLQSGDPAFGGFSSLSVAGDAFTLLSDGGNIVRFRMGADWRPRAVRFSELPDGPDTGWQKRDRDSESMAVDPDDGRIWVGFERYNAFWRYAPGFARAEGRVTPPSIDFWPDNGGPESLARMPDGRFVTISEQAHLSSRRWRGSGAGRLASRDALIFARDPLRDPHPRHFAYSIAGRYDVADAAALPNGDLVVLERDFRLPYRWSNRLTLVPAAEIRPGRVAQGRLLATLDTPLIHDNFEGVAVTQEGGATILWLVSDDNQSMLQRSLLLKFRLDPGA